MTQEAKEVSLQVDKNPFALSGVRSRNENNGGGMIAVASSRQAQEVQGMMVLAKKFPRDEQEAYARIMQACQRKGLAEAALYSYPKGGTQVTGPSIRLAEACAQAWGNLDFGIVELEQRDGESTVLAYCCDLQTNTRQSKIFQVRHERKAGGQIKRLDDPREIYELTANSGARRLRACILGVIPGDVIDAAVEQCDKTMRGANKEPLVDRVRVMATKFQEDFQVTVAMLEKRLGHKLDATNEQEMVSLRKIYTSLRDGMSKREDWFTHVAAAPDFATQSPNATDAAERDPAVSQSPNASGGEAEQGTPETQPASRTPEQPETPLGEKAPRKRAEKAAATAAPGPSAPPTDLNDRKSWLAHVTAKCDESKIMETELMFRAAQIQLAPEGTRLVQIPTETLREIVEAWDKIVAMR